jgi:hypothetical protein
MRFSALSRAGYGPMKHIRHISQLKKSNKKSMIRRLPVVEFTDYSDLIARLILRVHIPSFDCGIPFLLGWAGKKCLRKKENSKDSRAKKGLSLLL